MKRMKSYYYKLTIYSSIIFLFMILFVAGSILGILKDTYERKVIEDCGVILEELVSEYDDIQAQYYKIYRPFYKGDNNKAIELFCESDTHEVNMYMASNNIVKILKEACEQDSRIWGICFYDFNSESKYLYCRNDKYLKKINFDVSGDYTIDGEYSRFILGGRMVENKAEKRTQNVFGIQSGILKTVIGEKRNAYQVTVFYSLDHMDDIISKHQVSEDFRFLIMSDQGTVFYDSYGDYLYDEESVYMHFDSLKNVRSTLTIDGKKYLKGQIINNKDYYAFYLVPESSLRSIQLNNSSMIVIAISLSIWLLFMAFMIIGNSLVTKRVQIILNGIEMVEKNNLSYRITVFNQEDEFSAIAKSFNQMLDVLEETIKQKYAYLVLQKNAERDALQKSLSLHFLYNSLELIRETLIEAEQEDCSEMVLQLSRIYEYHLRGGNVVNIRTEISCLQTYIDFFSIRSKYRFQYNMEISEDVMNCIVPKLIFQPILENYYVHGFRGDGEDYINIKGFLDTDDGYIHFCFQDNGKGITQERIDSILTSIDTGEDDSSHIGLRNVNKRLKNFFGSDSYLDIRKTEHERGVSVILVFRKILKIEEMPNIYE